MKIKQMAFNVADPRAIAAWYCENFDLKVVRHIPQESQPHFVANSDSTILETYNKPPDDVSDYRRIHPLLIHLAFATDNPKGDRDLDLAAGAELVEEGRQADGSHLVMLRDPWGLAFQVCKRARPLFA